MCDASFSLEREWWIGWLVVATAAGGKKPAVVVVVGRRRGRSTRCVGGK